MTDQEIVDIIDQSGNVLRQALKTEAHKHGWLHKTVIGYLKYGDDWALVRQAADRQDAGQLVAPVGGHVSAGESDIEALLRDRRGGTFVIDVMRDEGIDVSQNIRTQITESMLAQDDRVISMAQPAVLVCG